MPSFRVDPSGRVSAVSTIFQTCRSEALCMFCWRKLWDVGLPVLHDQDSFRGMAVSMNGLVSCFHGCPCNRSPTI